MEDLTYYRMIRELLSQVDMRGQPAVLLRQMADLIDATERRLEACQYAGNPPGE